MLRRMIAEVFEQVTRPPGGPLPPMPRPRGESLRGAGERLQLRPERGEAVRDEERRARPAPAPALDPGPEPNAGSELAASLRAPGELRRAFVLMEVLGPPVSLRNRRDDPGRG